MQNPILTIDTGDSARGREPSAGDASLDALLNLLSEHDWQAAALVRHLPELLRQAPTLDAARRLPWLIGLQRGWQRDRDALDPDARRALLELACRWANWPLAIAVGESLVPVHRLDEAASRFLRDAYLAMGHIEAAIDLAVSMQLAYPARREHAEAYRQLVAWREWRHRNTLPVGEVAHEDDPLRLEPLGHQHIDDFGWQYYDPEIAKRCCLPRFEHAGAWHDWLDQSYAHGDQQLFAVMHRQWGCIGCVGLIQHRDVGLFYYWIGRDFQGYGFGPGAAAQLLAAAHRHAGMRCCYAKVYDYNQPSRSALLKIGFADTGLRAAAPHDDQLFYRIGEPDSDARVALEVHTLMARLDSELRIAMPLTKLGGSMHA
ncbi:GNAT family N-acetyltransferase [Burkholderia glumae]|uniref:GNAT family N-acetyltransferase n=1 Tax=Burkholderia glumae TaxID=337 RepID=UPI00039A76A2|nr:GNAT family N-acetyltransferase [Burkholderia glumae]MCM2493861.1 GNAT family N-acetyltransferase [Burkholderia glumae]MCM2547052.1 GNAT family N-acetyltransferase [Burkholderia glumae]